MAMEFLGECCGDGLADACGDARSDNGGDMCIDSCGEWCDPSWKRTVCRVDGDNGRTTTLLPASATTALVDCC